MNPFDWRAVLFAKHAQHVALVHFPIALIVAGAAFDLLSFRKQNLALLRAAYGEHPPEATAEYLRVFTADGGAALTGGLNWYRANDFTAPVGRITVPTMYVWSTGDVALGREAAEGTAAEVDGPYRFEVLEGVSHWIPEVAAGDLNRLLLDHLATA